MNWSMESYRKTRARMNAGEGFIYVAELIGTAIVKIGFSLDPKKRMTALRCHNGPIRLLAFTPGSFEAERRLHRYLHSIDAGSLPNRRRCEYYDHSILDHAAIPEGLRVKREHQRPDDYKLPKRRRAA